MSKSKLLAFEKKADNLASKLAVLSWPFDDLFSHIFNAIYYLNDSGMERESGDFCSRLSYLPALLSQQTKASSISVLDRDRLMEDWKNLIQYLHFCELMPQVYKGYFKIYGNESIGFHLQHKDEQLSNYEIRDILLADLARPFYISSSTQLRESVAQIPLGSQPQRSTFSTHLITERMDFCENNLHDLFQIPDSVYKDIFDVDRQEFNRFRCFMFAFSEFQESTRFCAKNKVFPSAQANFQMHLIQQSTFCFLPGEDLLDEIQKYTGLSKQKGHALIDLFTLDLRASTSKNIDRNKHSGDGYFPPIIRGDDGYYLSPIAIKSFLSNRNFLFALQKKDVSKFNNVISGSFEPEIISLTVSALSSMGNIDVRPNHNWSSSSSRGEIDLLIYCADLNKALVVQAKAVIPPQGARMVRNVQDRVLEGIKQIVQFNQLSEGERERIISEALGLQMSNIEIVDVVLSSSCLGSEKAWAEIDKLNICGINYALLGLLIYESIQIGDSSLLFDIKAWTKKTLDTLINDSKIQWEEKEFELFGTSIRFPSWSIDESPLRSTRVKIVEALEALPNLSTTAK